METKATKREVKQEVVLTTLTRKSITEWKRS